MKRLVKRTADLGSMVELHETNIRDIAQVLQKLLGVDDNARFMVGKSQGISSAMLSVEYSVGEGVSVMEVLNLVERNKDDIKHNGICGCCACQQIFLGIEITEYAEDLEDSEELSAICPYCSMVGVIPNCTDAAWLAQAHKHVFADHDVKELSNDQQT